MNDFNPNSVQSRRDNVVIQLLQLCRGRRAREGGSVPHAYPHNLNKCTTYPSQPHIIRGTAPVPSIVDLAPTLIKNTLVPIYRSVVMRSSCLQSQPFIPQMDYQEMSQLHPLTGGLEKYTLETAPKVPRPLSTPLLPWSPSHRAVSTSPHI